MYAFTFIIGGGMLFGWKYRYHFLSGRMRVDIIGENNRSIVRVIKAETSDKNFEIEIFGEKRMFEIRRNRLYTSGTERMPKAYYYANSATPRDMSVVTGNVVSPVRYREVAKQKVVSDLINAFKKQTIDNAQALMIMAAIFLLGLLVLGGFLYSQIDEQNKLIEQIPGVQVSK